MSHLEAIEAGKKQGKKIVVLKVSKFERWFHCCTSCLRSAHKAREIRHGRECENALLALCLLCAPAWAISVFDVEPKDHATVEGVKVEAGAVQAPFTGQVNAAVRSGAFKAHGELTANTTFNQPLATVSAPLQVDAPMTVQKGAFEFSLYPRAFSLNFDEGAFVVSPGAVVIKIDGSLYGKEMVQPMQAVAADVATAYNHTVAVASVAGGVVLALLVLCWVIHARGKERLITQLKERG